MNRMWAAHCLFDTKESTKGLWWMNRYKMKVTPKGFVATIPTQFVVSRFFEEGAYEK